MAGRSPFSPDKNHFHHRLMNLGFQHHEAVIVIYLVQIGLIVLGFTFKYQSDWILLLLFALFCVGFNGLFRHAEHSGWRYRGSWLSEVLDRVASQDSLRRYRYRMRRSIRPFLYVSIPLFLLICVWSARDLEGMLLIHGVMLVLSLILAWSPAKPVQSWFVRLLWYAACGLAVYSSAQTGLIQHPLFKLYMMLLVVAVVFSFQLETHRGLRGNPLDLIVLIIAVLMFYLGTVNEHFAQFGPQLTQAVIFLYAVELMLHGRRVRPAICDLSLAAVFALGILLSTA
jgi:UDP-GlcNAc:undecaprenyl-phosphate GlcNAc-1-phosphate transferase